MEKVFYHGGVNPNFSIDDIDLYRVGTKQNRKNRNNAGFYMFDEEKRDKAFYYADQTNKLLNVNDRGVIKITLEGELRIYTKEVLASIDRVAQEELKKYIDLGYDLISGKSYDGMQYILLNKEKIKSIEFESMELRYNKQNEFVDELKKSVNDIQNITKQAKNDLCDKQLKREDEIKEI